MYEEIIRIKLKTEREKAGYSQQQLAELTGIDDSLIAKIETGKRKPDVETIGLLAEFFGVSLDWLFGLGRRTPQQEESK